MNARQLDAITQPLNDPADLARVAELRTITPTGGGALLVVILAVDR